MTREAQKQRSMTGITKRTYNNFSALENEVECSICNNFGHEDSECRSKFRQTIEGTSLKHQNMENKGTTNRKMWDSLLCRRTRKSMVH